MFREPKLGDAVQLAAQVPKPMVVAHHGSDWV